MAKLVDEGIFALDHYSGYCAAKSLYPDAKSFCMGVVTFENEFGRLETLGDLDYLVAHTRTGYAHHCVVRYKAGGLFCWWQVEDEPGRGRSPVWYLDLD